MLFTEEVKDMSELVDKLSTFDQDFGKIKVCVVCFIFDKNGYVILNRRGPGARDEIGKLQAIGGSVNNSDANFREAMVREIREEAGVNAHVELGEFLGAQLNPAIDSMSKELINWIILGYKGNLVEGDVENMEPDRCSGFERGYMTEFNREELSITVDRFIQKMLNEK
ncbi:MAG: NUDIX hydrolase [Erysipelotrichales bacterium]|nr:NUDIX hydrolase [Erysipelotrichales bacterium]